MNLIRSGFGEIAAVFFLLQWQIDSKDIKKLNEITLYYIESICFIDRKNILCSVAKMYSH